MDEHTKLNSHGQLTAQCRICSKQSPITVLKLPSSGHGPEVLKGATMYGMGASEPTFIYSCIPGPCRADKDSC